MSIIIDDEPSRLLRALGQEVSGSKRSKTRLTLFESPAGGLTELTKYDKIGLTLIGVMLKERSSISSPTASASCKVPYPKSVEYSSKSS